MTRVLHISQPTEAGVANVLLSLVEDQVARGWAVHVASPTTGYLLSRAAALGAHTHKWESNRQPGPKVPGEVMALRRVIKAADPDLVHLHSAKAGLAGRLALHGSRPTIFQPHAWSFEAATGPVRRASAAWESFATRWTDVTVCVSEAERELGRRHNALAPQGEVVLNGVDTRTYTPGDRAAARASLDLPDGPAIVCVGRLCRQKGQDVLLAAWQEIHAAMPGARLYLVGDGPDAQILRAPESPATVFVGSAPALPWLQAADVVVLPSRWEGMPLALLEAMACGRPVVATRVNGVAEALGSRHPLAEPGQPEPLAGQVLALLADPDRAMAEGLANRQRAVDELDVGRSTAAIARLSASMARSWGRDADALNATR